MRLLSCLFSAGSYNSIWRASLVSSWNLGFYLGVKACEVFLCFVLVATEVLHGSHVA